MLLVFSSRLKVAFGSVLDFGGIKLALSKFLLGPFFSYCFDNLLETVQRRPGQLSLWIMH